MRMFVIGAGVTGLAFANAYGPDQTVIFEQSSMHGGKAKSYAIESEKGTFHFDTGGHWFHFASAPKVLKLLDGLELNTHDRHAFVWLDDQFFDFPIQASFIEHPNKKFVGKATKDLQEAQAKSIAARNYDEMLFYSYGKTLYDKFFKPYNQKLFGLEELSQISYGKFETLRNVRIGDKGYNNQFYYPKGTVGAQGIPSHLQKKVNVQYKTKISGINLSEQILTLNGKQTCSFANKKVINTMPIAILVQLIEDLDPTVKELSTSLRSSSGLILNFGVKALPIYKGKTWVYYPQRELSFYRLGFYSNVEPLLAPHEYTSMYVEVSPLNFSTRDGALELIPQVIQDLKKVGMIKNKEDIIVQSPIYIPHNYCFANKDVGNICDVLSRFGIYSIGRYGSWHWSSMHEDMHQAVELAYQLKRA